MAEALPVGRVILPQQALRPARRADILDIVYGCRDEAAALVQDAIDALVRYRDGEGQEDPADLIEPLMLAQRLLYRYGPRHPSRRIAGAP